MRAALRMLVIVAVVAAGCSWLIRWRRSSRPGQAELTDLWLPAWRPRDACRALVATI